MEYVPSAEQNAVRYNDQPVQLTILPVKDFTLSASDVLEFKTVND